MMVSAAQLLMEMTPQNGLRLKLESNKATTCLDVYSYWVMRKTVSEGETDIRWNFTSTLDDWTLQTV